MPDRPADIVIWKVDLTSSVLNVEQVYRVTKCHEPMYAEDEAICFVEGHRYGVSTEYLRIVEFNEITDDLKRLKRPNFWHTGDEE